MNKTEQLELDTQEKTKVKEKKEKPSKSNFDDSFLFYTNNNNLRTYLTHDALISRNHILSDMDDISFGDSTNWGIILCNKALSKETINEYSKIGNPRDNIYPVVLELKKANVSAYLIDNEYKRRKGKLITFTNDKHCCAVVYGYLPMSLVKNIHFREDQNRELFGSTAFGNIEFDKSMFFTTPELFDGELSINKADITPVIKKIKVPKISYQVSIMDKIRGVIHASIEGYENKISDSFLLKFNLGLLSNIASIYNLSNDEAQDDYKNMLNKIDSWYRKKVDTKDKFSYDPKTDIDPTPFNIMFLIKELLNDKISDESILLKVKEIDFDSLNQKCDNGAFLLALKRLLSYDSKSFSPQSYLTDLLIDIKDNLHWLITDKEESELDEIVLRYEKAINKITQNLTGFGGRLSLLLENWPSDFYTLKTLLIFLPTSSVDKFPGLLKKLHRYNLTEHERRMIWTYFGILHGMSAIGYQFKKDKSALLLSDMLTHFIINDKHTPNNVYPIPKKYTKSNITLIENSVNKSDPDELSLTITNGIGLQFGVVYTDANEILRNKIIQLIYNHSFVSKFQEILVENSKLADEYIDWIIKSKQVEITSKNNQVKMNFGKNKPSIEGNWSGWDDFVSKYINSQDGFKRLLLSIKPELIDLTDRFA